MSLTRLLFGRPIPNGEEEEERIGSLAGIPVLGLDALASAAYGPEAALTVLLVLGTGGLRYIVPLMLVIVAVLLIVQFSYRQTIAAYPDGGGSYSVARENLGRKSAMLAAAALALDYILNVAVAISAGVGALVSAVPALFPHMLLLCLALLALLTLVNLRGVRTTGLIFMSPTYLFVGCLGVTLLVGMVKVLGAHGSPQPVVQPSPLPAGISSASLWLLAHAFASGCTAMTGVEAVSNGIPIFREPRTHRAQRTLAAIVGILVALLGGVALLSHAYGIGATPPGQEGYQSVLSQLIAAVAGRGAFYYVGIAAIVSVLCLSANTSFADFPRVCRVLALDGYLPAAFAHAGRRMVYSTGIIILSLLSGALLVVFGGVTDHLIPLFAVGALSAFTLSQTGMVLHWRRVGGERARRFIWVNGVGAVTTGVTLCVVAVAKFTEGAWLTLVFIPLAYLLFRATHAHYTRVERVTAANRPMEVGPLSPPVVVVPMKRLDQVTEKGLRFALTISPEVHAVQVRAHPRECGDLAARWKSHVEEPLRSAGLPMPRLVVLDSTYRQLVDPLLGYVRELSAAHPESFIAVIVPELIERRWYHFLLHSHTATLLKMMLLFRGGPRVVVINAPWYLRERRRSAASTSMPPRRSVSSRPSPS
ncbi:APC family permease [Cystobacter ferrugineus]|uniref:Amino acid transporter n=1 Tax=Cystobacter ferrugineus TaxID=83449 RepID=A0A1L9B743_9BACT|nr:APC family permease [Cystobacter ferrugineus]OJH38033.1 amino acid transporter [Cystobacter ferrugineus]